MLVITGRARVRVIVAAVLAALAATLIVPAASATVDVATLTFEHPAPFYEGEAVDYTVTTADPAFAGIATIEAYDADTSSFETIDLVAIVDGVGHSVLYLGYTDGPSQIVTLRVATSAGTGPDTLVEIHEITLDVSATSFDLNPGDTTTLALDTNAPWHEGRADLYRRYAGGSWAQIAADIQVVDGHGEVDVVPDRAAEYHFTFYDEEGDWPFYDTEDFAVDVWFEYPRVEAPGTGAGPYGTFLRGQPVSAFFDWGGFGTSDTVTLQYEEFRMDEAGGPVWHSLATKTSADGHVAFTWTPNVGHNYRFKVVHDGGEVSYFDPFPLVRRIETAITAPSVVAAGSKATLSLQAKGWARSHGNYSLYYRDSPNASAPLHYLGTYDASSGKSTVTVTPKNGRYFVPVYSEDLLAGEPYYLNADAQTTIKVRYLSLYSSQSFVVGERVSLALRVSSGGSGSATAYYRTSSTGVWKAFASLPVIDGVARFALTPGGYRQIRTSVGGQYSNAVTLTPTAPKVTLEAPATFPKASAITLTLGSTPAVSGTATVYYRTSSSGSWSTLTTVAVSAGSGSLTLKPSGYRQFKATFKGGTSAVVAVSPF